MGETQLWYVVTSINPAGNQSSLQFTGKRTAHDHARPLRTRGHTNITVTTTWGDPPPQNKRR